MRKIHLPLLLAAGLAATSPACAEPNYGDIFSGLAQTLINQELDRTAYAEAQRVNTASSYRAYLTKFPKGAYRTSADQALAQLGAPVTPPPITPPPGTSQPGNGGNQSAASVEASIGLDRTQRILIQKQLTAIGYGTGVADGLWGTNTRGAIYRWQGANKLAATGYVTAPQVKLIAQQAGSIAGPDPTGPVAGSAALEERLLGLTYAERREVQSRLTTLGYSTYGVDGVFGGNTRRALASWQRDRALPISGYITADQLRALRSQTGG
jgi:peptidoglycan hydrolase-like protein with peptidoglycan-binding domain